MGMGKEAKYVLWFIRQLVLRQKLFRVFPIHGFMDGLMGISLYFP